MNSPNAGSKPGSGQKARTFLGRLARDRRGNTLVIMTAALFPLLGMIGSGVDMSRAYMAQNRLRQACDAGSLAGRRLLAGTDITDAIRAETTKYFAFNFPQGEFQTAAYDLSITAPATGTLRVEASTTIPTTVMKVFGFDNLPLTASCSATQDFVNTDIAMVFDLSGSMNCAPSAPATSNCNEVEQTDSKIGALRTAAKAFYVSLQTAQDQLHVNSLRLRYGFVNYNSTINVGKIVYAKNSDYLVQDWNYQSRWAREPADAGAFGLITQESCNQAYTRDADAQLLGLSGVAAGYWVRSFRGNAYTCLVYAQRDGTADANTYTYARTTFPVDVRRFLTSDSGTSSSAADASLFVGPADGSEVPEPQPTFWDGCIEERATNATAIDGGTATAAPSDAFDLDVDLIPNSDDTRWRPMWPAIVYWPLVKPASMSGINDASYQSVLAGKKALNVSYACPTQSVRLAEYYANQTGFNAYVDSLRARGGTYHDLGIIWGARFLSPDGIFRSATPETNNQNDPDNPKKIRGFSVKKYMIFMTDGQLAPQSLTYSSYGIEALDGRVMGTPTYNDGALYNRHLQRFRMACNAAKAKGIDIWVVAFATALTTEMQNCASKPEQASTSLDQAQLVAKFQQIGSKIGSLRLSQ